MPSRAFAAFHASFSLPNPQRRHGGGIGASLGMLSRYLGNENSGPPPDAPEPPDRLLRVAARVLGVRLEWLRTGAGAMTAEEEKRQQAQRMTRPEDAGEEMHDGLLKAHGFDADHFYRQDESALVLDLAYRWSFMLRFDRMDMAAREREWSRPEPPRLPDKDELDDALGRIRQVLDAANQATGRAFDLDTPATSQAYGHYFYLMCLALRMYPEASRRGTTPEERTVLTAQVIDQLERITNDPTERPEHREFAHERITFLRERSGEK